MTYEFSAGKNFHAFISIKRGKASEHDCVDCGEQAHDWSWIHGKYPWSIASYEPRCRSCHLKYDNRTGVPHLRKLSDDQVREIRKRRNEKGIVRTLSAEFDVTTQTIRNVINGTTYKEIDSVAAD